MAEKPDLKKFLSDPSFQGDRELLEGFFNDYLTRKEAEAKKKREEEDKLNPPSIFDRLFGGK